MSPIVRLNCKICSQSTNQKNRPCTCFEQQPRTLLEMADGFRERFPEKYKAQQCARLLRHSTNFGVRELSPFLQNYTSQEKELRRRLLTKMEFEKAKPKTITLQIRCSIWNKSSGSFLHIKQNDNSGDNDIQKKVTATTYKNHKGFRNSGIEITLTVQRGSHLNNGRRDEDDEYEKCYVSVLLLPDMQRELFSSSKLRTEYCNISNKGRASWQHAFHFQNYTKEELESKYFKLVVMGHTRRKKGFIGQTFIAGPKSLIEIKGFHPREPNKKEVQNLEYAMAFLDTSITSELQLNTQGAARIRSELERSYNISPNMLVEGKHGKHLDTPSPAYSQESGSQTSTSESDSKAVVQRRTPIRRRKIKERTQNEDSAVKT